MSRPGGTGRHRLEVPRGAVTAPDGLLLIDKPSGLTSHDVVAAARRLGATRKVGHAGTLDPMATGLLLIGLGRATRLLTYLVGADKTYTATLRLGQETTTEDAEGTVTTSHGCAPTGDLPGRLDAALAALTGELMQVPSAVSAIKVDGVRAYARVREGQDVALAARPVTIHALTRLSEVRATTATDGTAVVDVDLRVSCSSGTYVRALARDLGQALGCGAHLTALRRTSVGPFDVEQALTLEAAAAQVEAGAASVPPSGLTPLSLAEVARRCFPAVALDEAQARAIAYGQLLPAEVAERAVAPERAVVPKKRRADGAVNSRPVLAGFAPDGEVVALLTTGKGRTRPVLVLAPAAGPGRADTQPTAGEPGDQGES
ncbi:tRNA pseudouridine(55) synthase TruB [Actinomyces respiraculi]|uniref:tRNA pseudouridine(55) synthase TruB n=1 Tax=Actinomyces respiraculi TaxID=2744574 RepID=UPI0014224019|nr:tRNA pseudouridine(55) synthase TruB [Actinomyces respiraculi]